MVRLLHWYQCIVHFKNITYVEIFLLTHTHVLYLTIYIALLLPQASQMRSQRKQPGGRRQDFEVRE